MVKLILVTVGTSALAKCLPREKDESAAKNVRSIDYGGQKEPAISELTKRTKQVLENEGEMKDLSAEVASLLTMHRKKGIGPITKSDIVALLHTDTVEGRFCAEVTAEVLRDDHLLGWNVLEPVGIVGAKVKADQPGEDIAKIFVEVGWANYRQETERLVDQFRKQNAQGTCYLNITGGYKGLIPFGAILCGQLKLCMVYLYEQSDHLILWDKDYFPSHMVKETRPVPGEKGMRSY